MPGSETPRPLRIPRDRANDHTLEMAARRRSYVEEATGAQLKHVGAASIDPGRSPETSKTIWESRRCRWV